MYCIDFLTLSPPPSVEYSYSSPSCDHTDSLDINVQLHLSLAHHQSAFFSPSPLSFCVRQLWWTVSCLVSCVV